MTTERFNSQPPEGGWAGSMSKPNKFQVSTHSRPKAAGGICRQAV